ncbi:carcinoembryonic antigen-related cell adhesion molecule 7-like [Pleurodeles waltl]
MPGIFSSKGSSRCKQSLQGWILMAWLCVWPQRTAAQGPGAGVGTAEVGQTVTLTAPVTAGIVVFSWYRGTALTESQRILSYVVAPPAQNNGPEFTGRESGSPDGSLRIRDLRTNDSGIYTVIVTLNTATTTTGNQQLRVYGTGPTAWPQGTVGPGAGVVTAEVEETVTLTAPVTADILTFAWYRGTAVTEPQLILSYIVPASAQNNGPESTGRESGRPDGSLRIRDLRKSDSGDYTVLVTLDSGATRTASQQLRVYDSPCSTPGFCWQTTLGVACGVLLGAAIIVAGMAVHFERRLNQKFTNKDENLYQNDSVIKNPDTQVENMRKGRKGQSANEDSAADSTYMDLKHGDRAMYEQIRRP